MLASQEDRVAAPQSGQEVKLKVCAEQWWFRIVVVWPTDKTKQHWHTREV
jgi:hypothetical protein